MLGRAQCGSSLELVGHDESPGSAREALVVGAGPVGLTMAPKPTRYRAGVPIADNGRQTTETESA
jgi:threonine dehydrogenase-like Zn-dependent dehydrogenase